MSSPVDLTTKWIVKLSQYKFKYNKGKINVLIDYLSREDFSTVSRNLTTHPESIHDENVLPIPTQSP